jgi:hypothetical protein
LPARFAEPTGCAEPLAALATRRYEGRMIDIPKFLSRALILISVASLSACAGGNSAADLAPAAPQQAEPAPSTPAPASAPATAKRGAPAGRSTQGAAPPSASAPAPARQTAMTPEEIKAQCWMKYEEDKKIKNIDQRLALVEKCVSETSGNQPPPRN